MRKFYEIDWYESTVYSLNECNDEDLINVNDGYSKHFIYIDESIYQEYLKIEQDYYDFKNKLERHYFLKVGEGKVKYISDHCWNRSNLDKNEPNEIQKIIYDQFYNKKSSKGKNNESN